MVHSAIKVALERLSFFQLHRLAPLLMSFFATQAWSSDYGTTGLIDMPTARMASDGVLTATAAYDERHRQFALTYQAFPWLEATFRYTGFEEFFRWDRNYEAKVRLLKESTYTPQLAVGIRDMVGTGVFSGEYVVASKRMGPLDLTLGMGWGRLAANGDLKNPLSSLADRFSQRTADTGLGGEFSLGDFFSGPDVGIFGGLSYDLPNSAGTLLIERSSDNYQFNLDFGGLPIESPWSFGWSTEISPGVTLTLSQQNEKQLGISLRTAFNSKSEPDRAEPNNFISSYYLPQRLMPPQINKNRWYDRLLYDVERSGLLLVEGTLSADKSNAQLVVGNLTYPIWSDGLSVLLGLADLHLPLSVTTINFIVEENGHRVTTIAMPRPSSLASQDEDSITRRVRVLDGRTLNNPQHRTGFSTGKVDSVFNLRTRFQLFDPDDPLRYQTYMQVASRYTLSNHWSIFGSFRFNLATNFDESRRRESNSVLPKVRTDVVNYAIEGKTGVESLLLEVRDTWDRNLHYRGYAGLLEEMYGGVGGELLYWPSKSRVAVGLSVAAVKQREFAQRFGFRDYEVVTGFASAYWATPFNNYDMAIHVGRYLAKDVGATFELRRTFRSGWQVGAWATLTDVPFEQFGEGSFDKGLFFQIPLEGLFDAGRSNIATRLRPIQRDGGARLEDYAGNIFWSLRGARYDAFKLDERLVP